MDSVLLIVFHLYGLLLIWMWIKDEWEISSENSFIILQLKMTNLLTFLQGKKTTIGTILGLLITYSLTKGCIDNDLALLLSSLLVALGLGSNVATAKMVK